MSSTLLKYDMFLAMMNPSVNESYGADEILLESRNSGVRMVDYLQNTTINEDLELSLLTEDEKWDLENKMWEGAHFYATNDSQLFEGFFKSLIGGIKNLSKKALQVAKSILTGVGKVIKACGQYVMAFIAKVKEKGKAAAKSLWDSIKAPIDKQFEGKMGQYTEEEMEKEGEEWKSTSEWISGKGADAAVEMGAKDAASVQGEIESMDDDERDEMLKAIADKEKAAKESKQTDLDRAITRAMNEMRGSKNFDIEGLVEYAMVHEGLDQYYRSELGLTEHETIDRTRLEELQMSEGLGSFLTGKGWNAEKEKAAEERTEKKVSDTEVKDPGADPQSVQADKKKSIWERFKEGFTLKAVISILVSGVVTLVEKLAEFLFKKSFSSISSWVKKFGGPGVFTFACISGILAVAMGMILEFGMEAIGKMTGAHVFEEIAHGLHAMNPSYWIEKGVNLLVPGMGTFLGITAKVVCLALAAQHVIHVFAHNRKEIDHDKGMAIDREEIGKIDKQLESGDVSDEDKAFLEDQKRIREDKIRVHKSLKHIEHEKHHISEEIAKIKKKEMTAYRSDEEDEKMQKELKAKKEEYKKVKEEVAEKRKELDELAKEFKQLKDKNKK
jgi:hypothetical protein